MCRVIAIGNQKGGTAKSTTACNLGIGLVREGQRVLLIDADSQGSLTASLGYREPDSLDYTLATVMEKIISDEEIDIKEGILHHEEGVDLLPGNIELSGLEVSLVNVMSRERILSEYTNLVKESYDWIIIDCMPSLSMITTNALATADEVIIPVQSQYLSARGMGNLLNIISKVRRQINKDLKVGGILLTLVDSRTKLPNTIKEQLEKNQENLEGYFLII